MSEHDRYALDQTDKRIINVLQTGFPIHSTPFVEAATELAISEEELLFRVQRLLDEGILTRFGPMYDAAEFGGGLTLAAMSVPDEDFDGVSDYLNTVKAVAHNYEREHRLNMWFVIATEHERDIPAIIEQIECQTGLTVYNMPKLNSFFVNLYLPVQ